jgi:hypothetical protein
LLAAFVFTGCDGRPVVSVSMTPLTLDERVPDELAVTFTVVGSIPDGGLVLEFGSDTPGALNEFDVTGSNPRQPGEAFEPRGPLIEPPGSGAIDGVNGPLSAFTYRLRVSPSTLRVYVWRGDGPEGLETFRFSITESELFRLSPNASGGTLTIID